MTRVAVTGADGFIGSNIVRRLVADGHQVRAIGRVVPADRWRREAWDAAAERIVADLREVAPFHGVTHVVHLAADMGGVGYFHGDKDFGAYLNNSRISATVLDAAARHGVERLFAASSACAYGTNTQMTEGFAPRLAEHQLDQLGAPDALYGREKLSLLRLCEQAPFDARVGILHNVFGTGQEAHGQRRKFPAASAQKARAARTTGTAECWGNGAQLRSYLWIDDAVERIMRILFDDLYVGPVNVGTDGAISCLDVLRLCCELAGVPNAEITFTPDMPSGVLGRDCDNTLLFDVYGDVPQTSYADGFGALIDWLDAEGIDP